MARRGRSEGALAARSFLRGVVSSGYTALAARNLPGALERSAGAAEPRRWCSAPSTRSIRMGGTAAPAAVLPPVWALLLGAVLLASPAAALDNGLRLPPLGWSSWCVLLYSQSTAQPLKQYVYVLQAEARWIARRAVCWWMCF